jgi:hypothetical protein
MDVCVNPFIFEARVGELNGMESNERLDREMRSFSNSVDISG